MANYENIRPYAELVHTAAAYGGVESYLNQISKESYELGVMHANEVYATQSLIVGGLLLAGYAGIALYRKYIMSSHDKEREEYNERIKAIKAQMEETVRREREAELNKYFWENSDKYVTPETDNNSD